MTPSGAIGRYKKLWFIRGVPHMHRTDVGFVRVLGIHMMGPAGRCMSRFSQLSKWQNGSNATCLCETFCCSDCRPLEPPELARVEAARASKEAVAAWKARWHWPLS